MFKAIGKFQRTKLHASQHPLNDVAVMAEKPARLSTVMAMIRSNLFSVEASAANSALAVLSLHKGGYIGGGHSGSAAALAVENGGIPNGVRADGSVIRGRVGLLPRPSLGAALRVRIANAASLFHGRISIANSALGAYGIAIGVVVSRLLSAVGGPLFGRAIGFSHTRCLARCVV